MSVSKDGHNDERADRPDGTVRFTERVLAEFEELKKIVAVLDNDYASQGYLDERLMDGYVKNITYAIFSLNKLRYARDLIGQCLNKVDLTIKSAGFKDVWDMESKIWGQDVYLLRGFYQLCLLNSFWDFESFIFFMEQDRPQVKRFYLPRVKPLKSVLGDLEDLANRKIKFLGVSLPARTGKSTLCIFFLAWVAMRRPNSHSAMGGHSGVLTKGFYKELMNLFDSTEYRFGEIYRFWHEKEQKVITDKSAEDLTINLGKPDRFSTLTCRSIDATWTGAVDVSWDGVLYVDDLVRDREHSLSPTRMENTWQEYLNKMVDRKSGFNPSDINLGFDMDVSFEFDGACELMVGTLWNVYDPLYRMEQTYGDNPLYRFRKIPALDENDESNFNYSVNGFTTEYYKEMRERLDEPEWMAKYQQAPFVREGILINKNELNYFNGEIVENIQKVVGILDPAVGGGDYLSMVVIAECPKRKFVIDWVYSRETKGKTIPELCAKIMAHNITEVHYERNGIGRVFDDELTQKLHNLGYFRCKMTSFAAPEGMSKEEKIIGYSDWVKSSLWFIDENAKSTTYTRSNAYSLALSHVFIYTSVGKNKWDDAIDNLAQAGRVYEKQRNGTVDIILNPFARY